MIRWNTDVNAPGCPGEIVEVFPDNAEYDPDTTASERNARRRELRGQGLDRETIAEKIRDEFGPRSILVQTDWEYPATASAFGWSLKSVQRCVWCGGAFDVDHAPDDCESNEGDGCDRADPCDHDATDGTVDCTECGVTATDFISAAYDWLRDNDGATAEDPGYFTGE